jgi:hypothetical protein
MEMVILKDGRRGLFSKELMTIKTLELWEGDLPSITYHLTEQDLEDQVIRTVGGLANWVFSNS